MITSDTIESAATPCDSELQGAQPALTIPELLRRAAKQYDQRVAIQEDGLRLTYAALDTQRVEVAKAMLALGVAPGDRVAVWAPNLSEWILVTLAAQSIGAVMVPINTRMKGLEVAAILADSGARVLFCIDHFLGESYPDMLAPHRPACIERTVVLRPRAERPMAEGELLWPATSLRTTIGWRNMLPTRRASSTSAASLPGIFRPALRRKRPDPQAIAVAL